MIKNLSSGLLFLFLLVARTSIAQLGIGTTSPDPSAQLEIKSTSKGLLIPRVTSTTNVPTPAEGLLVYQTTAPVGFYVYKGGNWVRLTTTEDGSGSASGVIIPYASGMPVILSGGPIKSASLVGFGHSSSPVLIVNDAIDLSGGSGLEINFAFPIPRSGTITSISGYFNTNYSLSLATPVTVTVQLYQATGSSNSFTPIANAVVSLAPALTGAIAANTTSNGLVSGLAIPVTAGTRLLLVFSLSTTSSWVVTMEGYVSGSVQIN